MITISNKYFYLVLSLFFLCLVSCEGKGSKKNGVISNNNKKNVVALKKEKTMDLPELEKKILSKDWDAVVLVDAAEDKNEALPLLKKLCDNEDNDIRIITIECLLLLDAKEIPELLVRGLSDKNETIRETSMGGLYNKYDKSIIPQLLENLNNEDEGIRDGVAFIIGKIGDNSVMPTLEKSYEKESNPETKRSMMLALAKLGDNDKREEIVSQFDKEDSNIRLQAIEDLKYINDPDLSGRILPALDDMGKAYKINPIDNLYSRVCDAAVNLIAFLHNDPFSFEAGSKKIYTKEEIEEAKKFLQSLQNK